MDMPNWSTDDALTSSEVAALLGVERRTVLRMEERGAIRSWRPHPTAHRRYRLSDVLAIRDGGDAS